MTRITRISPSFWGVSSFKWSNTISTLTTAYRNNVGGLLGRSWDLEYPLNTGGYYLGSHGIVFSRLYSSKVSGRRWNTLEGSSKAFSDLIEKSLKRFNGMIFSNEGRPLVGWLKRSIGPLGGRLSRSRCALLFLFTKKVYFLYKAQGRKGLVLFLKASHVLIQQSIAGDIIRDMTPLKIRVKRARTGLPSWIPVQQRRLLLKGDPGIIRFWTSLVALYRVIDFPGVINLESIMEPGLKENRSLADNLWETILVFWRLLDLPKWRDLWITQKFTPFPIGKSGPLDGYSKDDISTSWHSIMHSAYALMTSHQRLGIYMSYYATGSFLHSPFFAMLGAAFREASEKLPPLWKTFSSSMPSYGWLDKRTGKVLGFKEMGVLFNKPGEDDIFDVRFGIFKYDSDCPSYFIKVQRESKQIDKPVYLGKLGAKPEPAGKVRIFAMVDSWTQWLFHPLHKLIQDILRGIEEDCTFDQIGGVEKKIKVIMDRKYRKPKAFSYDLSSATDRLPIWIQKLLLRPLMGDLQSDNWAKVLVERRYLLPNQLIKDRVFDYKSVSYSVGQPMGALSSWVLLALTHHLLVQFAAHKAGVLGWRYKWFKDYVVLGDDIVIFNSQVAMKYYQIMTQQVGVKIGLAKSISSRSRLVSEFAKKYWVDGQRAFMLPVRDVIVTMLSTQTMLEFIAKHEISLNHYLKLRGLGYRARAKVGANLWSLGSRMRTFLVVYSSDRFFLDWISMKSLTTNWELDRNTIWRIAEELVKDHKRFLHRLQESRVPKEGSPWIWSANLHSLMKFPRFLATTILTELMPKRAEFIEIIRRWEWICGRFELGLTNRNCSDEFLRDMLTDMIVSLEEASDIADEYSLLTWYSQTRQEDKPFSRWISQYKRWVRYNGIVMKAMSASKKDNLSTKRDVQLKVFKFPGLEMPDDGEDYFRQNYIKPLAMAYVNWPWLTYLPLVWFQIKRFIFAGLVTWCVLWGWAPDEPLAEVMPREPGIPESSWEGKPGPLGPPVNVFDVLLAMILGAWVVVLLFGMCINIMHDPEVASFLSMLREGLEWVGTETVETPEIRVVSEFRFPNYRELIEWANERVPEGSTRSPQIGHGWTEYSPVNWDWPDTWR